MTPCDEGRICHGCGKLVVDFRDKKWSEIEKIQQESILPLCGIYDKVRIDNWGLEISTHTHSCSRLLSLSATLLALAQVSPLNLSAQNRIVQHQVSEYHVNTKNKQSDNDTSCNHTIKRIIIGTIVAKVYQNQKKPLLGAQLCIATTLKTISTHTDSFGRFYLDISSIFDDLSETFQIILTPSHTKPYPINFVRKNIKPDERNIFDITVTDYNTEDGFVSSAGSSFYIAFSDTPTKAAQKKESRIKRWWHKLTKHHKKNVTK